MNSKTKIILTSDDFGLSTIYNEKMLGMLEENLLTSVSVMVNRISESQHCQIKQLISIYKKKQISIGLHLELSELKNTNEVISQNISFEKILGFKPDYLDLHKARYIKGDFNIIADFCNNYHIAFRKYPQTTCFVASPSLSITATYIDIDTLEKKICDFEEDKIYEIIFHIGVYDPNSKSKLNKERELDIKKLVRVNELIKQRELSTTNYKNVYHSHKIGNSVILI